MDKTYLPVVGKGLTLLSLAGVISLFALAALFIPALGFFGIIAALAAIVLTLYASVILSKCHPKFKIALFASIVMVLLTLLAGIPASDFLATMTDIASFFSAYMICLAVDEFMQAFSEPQFPTGALVWKIRGLLLVERIIERYVEFSMPLIVVHVLVSLVAAVFYMMLLYKSSKALAAATRK